MALIQQKKWLTVNATCTYKYIIVYSISASVNKAKNHLGIQVRLRCFIWKYIEWKEVYSKSDFSHATSPYSKLPSISYLTHFVKVKNSWMRDPRCKHEYLDRVQSWLMIIEGEAGENGDESDKHI